MVFFLCFISFYSILEPLMTLDEFSKSLARDLIFNEFDGNRSNRTLRKKAYLNTSFVMEEDDETAELKLHILSPLNSIKEKKQSVSAENSRFRMRCSICSTQAGYYCDTCYASTGKVIPVCSVNSNRGHKCLLQHISPSLDVE